MKQGLALEELVEMKTSIRREAQGESGWQQSPTTAGATWTADLQPSSELSDGGGVAARREGVIPEEADKYTRSLKPRDESPIVGALSVRSR